LNSKDHKPSINTIIRTTNRVRKRFVFRRGHRPLLFKLLNFK
jgi:hypothetical protein